jgi:hypothetical protein
MSRRQRSHPQEILRELDYTAEGGYLDALAMLIRWLKAASCYEYADQLARELNSLSLSPRLAEEAETLAHVRQGLEHIVAHPPPLLTADQRTELRELQTRAYRLVKERRRQIVIATQAEARASQYVARRQEAIRAANPDDQAHTSSPQAPHPDGLEGGRWLWWQNQRYDIPQGIVYRMIEYMWNRDSARYDDLIGPVFDEPVEPQTIRSYANKVRNALPCGWPWRLSTDATSRQLTKASVTIQNP